MIYWLLALAFGPALALAIFVYWRDKFEREPLSMLARTFVWGMLSVPVALFLELGWSALGFGIGTIPQSLFFCYICIALSEEFSRFIFLRRAMRKDAFNEPYDGITYSVMIAMGFASVENLVYLFQSDDPITLGLLRMFTAIPAHATFGILMGYFAGLARFNPSKRSIYLTFALLTGVLFHGSYDFFLILGNKYGITAGAFVSLGAGIILSLRAIRLHQRSSPFRPVS